MNLNQAQNPEPKVPPLTVSETINGGGFSAYLHSFGAIDSWLHSKAPANHQISQPDSRSNFILTNADTSDLAKMFEGLRFPGVDLADAALESDNQNFYFRCAESFNECYVSFPLLEFYMDCSSRVFYDPRGIYTLLKEIKYNLKNGIEQTNLADHLCENLNIEIDRVSALTDTALILAKYFPPTETKNLKTEKLINKMTALLFNLREGYSPCAEEQRILLCDLMTSPNPGLGMELLNMCGFISKFWPELAALEEADHSKEFHPEGNAWQHTMETFRHRKSGGFASNTSNTAYNLRLSLGLLLHDMGKPVSPSTGNHRYEGHAELGEVQARRFLERLGFGSKLINDVCFLVTNHMLPAALPRLPLYRTSSIMSSPLFPLLMELYRCDESSSFKGLHGYYESSAKYQQFLRNQKNPYRAYKTPEKCN